MSQWARAHPEEMSEIASLPPSQQNEALRGAVGYDPDYIREQHEEQFTRCTTCGSYIPRTPPDEGVPMCSCGGRPKVWETPTE